MVGPPKSECCMYLKSIQGGAIRTLCEVLKDIVHDVLLQFDSTGVSMLYMDGAGCVLINMKLHAENFEEFHCSGKYTAGLNMLSLFRLIRTTGSHDTVTLYLVPGCSDELGITIQNSEKKSMTDFRLKLLEVDTQEVLIPDVEFDAIITMPSAYFQRLCRDASNIATHMTIKSQGGTLVLSCEGDFARQETVIGQADAGMSIVASPTMAENKFSLKFLTLLCKASGLCNTFELYLKESFPLVMKCNVASLGEIKFLLAPSLD